MALGPDRYELQTDLSFFCDTATERGVLLVHKTSGKGQSLDDKNAVVTLKASAGAGDVVAGLLLNDVVATDPSLNQLGRLKDQSVVGGKVTLGVKGWWVTNMIAPGTGVVPSAGKPAYLANNGLVTDNSGNQKVGKFLSSKSTAGFVKLEMNID